MAKSFVQELGERLASVESRLSSLSSGNRLDHASLDGTTLYLRDSDGNLSGRLGRQPDGSNGVHVVRVQPPPQLTAPILTVGQQAGTCLVEWDGNTFDGRRMPLIHGHTEIWAELVGEDWSPTVAPGGPAKRVGTIRDRTGGEAVVALPQAGVWAVWLRAMGADRETAGPWSPVSTVEVKPLVDTEAIEAELEDARDRITEADERLTAGQQSLAVNLDDLNDVRLPALRDRLDTIEPVIEDYDGRIAQAQQGADSAYNSAATLRDEVLPPLQNNLTDLRENRLPTIEGALNQTRLGMENLRDERLPELDQQILDGFENADARIQRLAIGASSRNIITDPYFLDEWNTVEGWYPVGGASANDFVRAWWASRSTYILREGVRGTGWASLRYGQGRIEALPGGQYRFEARQYGNSSAEQQLRINVGFIDVDGNTIWHPDGYHTFPLGQGGDAELVYEWAVPSDASIRTMFIQLGFLTESTSGWIGLYNPELREKTPGKLVVDGSISARHIMAESIAAAVGEFLHISAEQIDTENLAAYLATIIELDAGQITAGKINTARLDAQEVAGAVANFLTLDALEINVEQLAGEIANIIEITAESIQAGAIQARHLSVVNNENLFGDDDWSGISADPNTGGWRIDGATPSQVSVRQAASGYRVLEFAGAVGTPTSRVDVTYPGPGWKVRPGDTFHYSFVVWRNNAAALNASDVRFWFPITDRNGNYAGTAGGHDSLDSEWTTGYTTYEGELEIPDDIGEDLFMRAQIRATLGSSGAQILFARPFMRRKSGGELIVDGGIKARNLDAEEIFAAQAVIEKIWTDIVRSRLVESQGIITEDMIATGAITTPKLTVTEEMVGEVAKLIRIEAGSLASNDIEAMRIVSSVIESSVIEGRDANGELTYRLDGMDNLLMGRIHAGMTEGAGITMDYGEQVLNIGENDEGEPDQTITWTAPYMEFETSGNYDQYPRLTIDPNNGGIRLFPGVPTGTHRFRGKLNVSGDVRANRLEARDSMSALTGYHLPRSSNQPGGLTMDSSLRTRLLGRMADSHGPHDMVIHGTAAESIMAPGSANRGQVVFDAPAPTGLRQTHAWGHVANTSWGYDSNRAVTVSTAARSASSFRFTRQAARNNSGDVQCWVYYAAYWV